MSRRSRSQKLNTFLDGFGFDDQMINGNAVIRLISPRCGIDFDFDPRDNLHFVGIFNPKMSSGEQVEYVVYGLSAAQRERVYAKRDLLEQWEVYVDILETDFKHYLEGRF